MEYTRTQMCLDTRSDTVVGTSIDYVTKANVKGLAEDPATAAMVADYRLQLAPVLDVKIGSVSGVFPRGGVPPVERSGETPIGDYIADAIRTRYGTELAFIAGGNIRDTLPAGNYQPLNTSLRRPGPGTSGPYDVTMGDALTVLPFGNSLVTTSISGANVWAALENGVSGYPVEGRFPQISGLRFTFDPSRPKGSRILSVTKVDGSPIARDITTYTATTIDYMLNGGDGYANVFSPSIAVVRDLFSDVFADALRRDMATGKVTALPANDGRIAKVG